MLYIQINTQIPNIILINEKQSHFWKSFNIFFLRWEQISNYKYSLFYIYHWYIVYIGGGGKWVSAYIKICNKRVKFYKVYQFEKKCYVPKLYVFVFKQRQEV